MKIISELVEVGDRQLFIPWYHRVSPNLQNRSKVNGVLLPPSEDTESPEIVISQYPYQSWGDLWLIDFLVNDKEGVLWKVASSLEKGKINLLNTEITTVFGRKASITLVADLMNYVDPFTNESTIHRQKSDAPSIASIEDYLKVVLSRDLCFVDHGSDQKKRLSENSSQRHSEIRTQRLNELHQIHEAVSEMEQDDKLDSCLFFGEIENGVLSFDEGNPYIWDTFTKNMITHESGKPCALVTSDTQQGYLKFSAVTNVASYLTIKVPMKDEAGQLRKCLAKLKEEMSVKTAYETLQTPGEAAWWTALLEHSGTGLSRKEFEGKVKKMLADEFSEVKFPRPIKFGGDPVLDQLREAVLAVGQHCFSPNHSVVKPSRSGIWRSSKENRPSPAGTLRMDPKKAPESARKRICQIRRARTLSNMIQTAPNFSDWRQLEDWIGAARELNRNG